MQETSNAIFGLPLEKAHVYLLENGFEIAHSSLFSKKQLWYNEDLNECISFKFNSDNDNKVESVSSGKERKCIRGVRAARRVWANYIDGGADAHSTYIDREREILQQNGYIVSYWVRDVSPGKTMEVWYNREEQLCMSISWDKSSKSNVKVLDRDPRLGENPAPVYNTKNL